VRWLRVDYLGLALAAAIGILIGVGVFTFDYGKGGSYFSKAAESCTNCHIMQGQYDSWLKSGHAAVASCVDCHLPQDNLVNNYLAKAENGWHHSWAFTFQNFHEPIQITPKNERLLQNNCVRCHAAIVEEMATTPADPQTLNCVHCHAGVGHGG
jgi:cytochrome c nitrite reductase small subunit